MQRRAHIRFGFDPLSLDDDTAERILSARISSDDAPHQYGPAVELLSRAASIAEPHGRDAAVAMIVDAIAQGEPITQKRDAVARRRGKRVFGKLITTKIAVISAGAVLSMGGVAAAATGTLPDGAQNAVASTVAHVGVDLPKANTPTAPTTSTHPDADLCHAAQQVPGAHGCSAVAHADAPGQNKTTDTSIVPDDTSVTGNDHSSKADDPTATGESHESTEGAEHGQGPEHAGGAVTSTTVAGSGKSSHGESGNHGGSGNGSDN